MDAGHAVDRDPWCCNVLGGTAIRARAKNIYIMLDQEFYFPRDKVIGIVLKNGGPIFWLI